VFPTPPFDWLLRSDSSLPCPHLGGDDDFGIVVGHARLHTEATLPCPARFDQFGLRASPLREHPNRLFCGQMVAHAEETRKRCDRATRNHVETARDSFGLRLPNLSGE